MQARKQCALDIGSIIRSTLILRQLAGGNLIEKVYTRLYKDLNATDTSETHAPKYGTSIDMHLVTTATLKQVCQRVSALAYKKLKYTLVTDENEFLKKHGAVWTDPQYKELRINEAVVQASQSSAKRFEDEYISRLCENTVECLNHTSVCFENDVSDPSRILCMFIDFVRKLPPVNNEEFATIVGEFMGRLPEDMRTQGEYGLLRLVVIQTEAVCYVNIDDVIDRVMRGLKAHKDQLIRHAVVIEECPIYWLAFVNQVEADLAVHGLSYENLHAVVCSLLMQIQPSDPTGNKNFCAQIDRCATDVTIDDRERNLLHIAKGWLVEVCFADYVINSTFSIELFLHKLSSRMMNESGY